MMMSRIWPRLVLLRVLLLTLVAVSFSWSGRSFSLAVASSATPPFLSRGLYNLGNTCYLNAQLQCAYHIPRVRHLIETPPSPSPPTISEETPKEEEENHKEQEESKEKESDGTNPQEGNDATTKNDADHQQTELMEATQPTTAAAKEVPEVVEPVAIQALRKVFQEMESATAAYAPRKFCQALGIPIMEQQDSQEFWKLLLPALQVPALTDLYQGCFEDYIKALDGSNRERRREEPFLDLSLDVSRDSVVEGLKESFGSPELLSEKEGNGWRPEKGADKVDALKGSLLRVQGLPSILQLHLKRFNYDWQTDRMSKLNNRCSFPQELDLSTICEDIQDNEKETAQYALQSIVIHTGEYGAGHYYAYVRPNIQSDEWYRFNDHIVEKVTYEDVIADAYGGRNARPEKNHSKDGSKKRKGPCGLLRRLASAFQQKDPFGYGGRTSNAYVVQYVRQCDIPTLYCYDNPQA